MGYRTQNQTFLKRDVDGLANVSESRKPNLFKEEGLDFTREIQAQTRLILPSMENTYWYIIYLILL